MSRVNVYENIIIGNYLFLLGTEMARRNDQLPPISINLLQQMPADKTLADLLLANRGMCRIIEFKRAGKVPPKEKKKLIALRSGIENTDKPRLWRMISGWLHWYVEFDDSGGPGTEVTLSARRYLDLDEEDSERWSIQKFASDIADEAFDEEINTGIRRYMAPYVTWVCKFFSDMQRADAEARGAGGVRVEPSTTLLVALDGEKGLSWVSVPNIECAMMNRVELFQHLGISNEPDTPQYDQKISRGLSI